MVLSEMYALFRRNTTHRAHLNRFTVNEDFAIGGRAKADAQSLGILLNLLEWDVCAFSCDKVKVRLHLSLQRALLHDEPCEFPLEDIPVDSSLLGICIEHLKPRLSSPTIDNINTRKLTLLRKVMVFCVP